MMTMNFVSFVSCVLLKNIPDGFWFKWMVRCDGLYLNGPFSKESIPSEGALPRADSQGIQGIP